jgi:succinate dehydrogenase/fumarate reductase flavoprotein subunit
MSEKWDYEAEVVVIGSGAMGMPAAIRARDQGASVIVVEANYDIGGHAMLSGGNIPLGGGTSAQKKYGIEDSPDLVFQDLTDWSIVETNGMPEYRYNDRAVQRAFADNCAPTYEFLIANGVKFSDIPPDKLGGHAVGLSAPRENHTIPGPGQGLESPMGKNGATLMTPLEASAREKGVQFLLNYHMDSIVRETPASGRVLGIKASYTPTILPGTSTPLKSFSSQGNIDMTSPKVSIKATKAVIIATGGSSSNVNFRRIFDPRLTEEYQTGGEPFSYQDASGEIAAMAIGASLWGTANQAFERNGAVRKRGRLGAQYSYTSFGPDSPIFPLCRAIGLRLDDWRNVICVNQVGQRFYDETGGNWPTGTRYGDMDPYVPGSYLNAENTTYKKSVWKDVGETMNEDLDAPDFAEDIPYRDSNWIDAALKMNEGSTAPDFSAGPTWAIFDSEIVSRQGWILGPPNTDPDYFFSGDTISQLARNIKGPYQKIPMKAATLEATVARYNSFADTGIDLDFGKPTPMYKIETPPFYAAWASPVVHDTYAGLRINMQCQVLDINGELIPGLYCGGESAGGCSQHGLGRCTTQGYIAGKHAAGLKAWD